MIGIPRYYFITYSTKPQEEEEELTNSEGLEKYGFLGNRARKRLQNSGCLPHKHQVLKSNISQEPTGISYFFSLEHLILSLLWRLLPTSRYLLFSKTFRLYKRYDIGFTDMRNLERDQESRALTEVSYFSVWL